ncbi:MAG TPA: glycosyltransferase [Gemmatales bacterium]|nr:glycosyltransferase [Gemmatales bacterium]
MLRVLHVVPNINLKQGGPARSVLALIEALRRVEGLQLSLATASSEELVEHPLQISGRWSLINAASRPVLEQAIQQSDLVELHSIWNGVISYAGKTARLMNKPYIYTPHGMLDPYCLRSRSWLKKIWAISGEERNIAGARGFHVLSEEEKSGILQARPYLSGKKFVVSPNGVDVQRMDQPAGVMNNKFPDTLGRKVVLFLGRLDVIKGLELPLQAIASMEPHQRPMILLVGPDFGDEGRLKKLAATLGIAPWVIFAGPVYGDDRFSLLAEADLVGLTSHYECNSVTATEALAVGGAVLATEGSSLRHAALAGAAKVVPRTAEAYAKALHDLLYDERQLRNLRKSARLYAQRQLNWDRLVVPLVELYRKIAMQQPARGESCVKGID